MEKVNQVLALFGSKLGPVPFHERTLFPFFDGLIPEGWLLEFAEQTWKLDPGDRRMRWLS